MGIWAEENDWRTSCVPFEKGSLIMEQTVTRNSETSDHWVVFEHGQGSEIGKLMRLTRHVAVFEMYALSDVLQTSQVLADFKILSRGEIVYAGRAVVRSLINAGVAIVCEVSLNEEWMETRAHVTDAGVRGQFAGFLQEWQRVCQVGAEFKVVVADLHSFLSDLRLWLDQYQLAAELDSRAAQEDWERAKMQELEPVLMSAINRLHEHFESVIDQIESGRRPEHQHFARRHLHGLFLCSPFGRRAYQKPLGYAGDYEMVNMIMRQPYEGESMFAKTINGWLLRQYPSEAHRNRIGYLIERLTEEALRARRRGNPCRVLSLGCGPAHELQSFLANSPLADTTEFDLIDMNEETLSHLRGVTQVLQQRYGRRTMVRFHKRSVFSLLKESTRGTSLGAETYDFIYCAGLFDYLSDTVCRQLLAVCYTWLKPEGLLLATNVATYRPFRHMMEFLLDWHLVYRDRPQMAGLVPCGVSDENWRINSDATGVNLFLEIRRSTSK
jgi:extracellular factor (EF) 3-hydroxypalmitic acid methyl ester biosynthesis protein